MADNKNNSERNVPPLRFPEFTGEWQCKAIEKVAPLQRGFDLPTQNLVEGIYPVIYSNGILQHHDKYKCEAPGLITGRSGTIGKFTYIDSGFYWPHNTSLWVTDFCGNCPKFIYYLYQTVHIEQFSTGSGVPTLNRNDVHRYKTSVPTAIVEQEKIAKFLSILDERIVTQNKIIEKYESLIKGIAQHCIKESISGITYVKLGDICQISTG
ncbi:restriction endonuclease subunit S, partial [Bacteroides fragilis]|uniref:restriction endonuclease subunit S n=1 Tax=Bacteroides fragilis TaxID=817 RepID=UPI000AE63A63